MKNSIMCDPTVLAPGNRTGMADVKTVKSRQQTMWASGDFAVIGTTLQIVGEELCEAMDLRSGQRVLDVAAGNGNAALAAARRWCDVTASDYVPALLDRARERALGERLALKFEVADAEALPFPDESFDAVTSTFGAMFTPDHAKPAKECCAFAGTEERSVWPIGRRKASSANCSRRSDVIFRHPPA
jgi:SAM-dependent methyltransferase